MRNLILGTAAAALLATGLTIGTAKAAEGPELPHQQWSFQGIFGTFDRTAVRRGMQIYLEVCSNCHSLNQLSYRHLEGIGLTEDEVKAVAEKFEVEDGPNDQGEMFSRKAKPSDHFAKPFPNAQAARLANGGALPPDLSLMTKARKGGPDYVYALLTGYTNPPAGFNLLQGMNYNAIFPGNQIGMPQPLTDDRVTYPDQTKATIQQEAQDIVTFLSWAAEPEMEARKRLGIKVLMFLIILTGLLYAVKRKVWSDVH